VADLVWPKCGGKYSWDDVTSGTALVLTLPLLAREELPSYLHTVANIPASVIAIGAGKFIQLCRGAGRSKVEKSLLYAMNCSSSTHPTNAVLLHRVLGADRIKIVVEVLADVSAGEELLWKYGGEKY